MPDDYEDKFRAAKEKRGDQYAHLDIPDLKKFRPRKRLDEEVLEQEVYGIDPFTYNMLLNTMPADTPEFTEKHKQLFIEEVSKEPSPLTLCTHGSRLLLPSIAVLIIILCYTTLNG